MLKMPSREAQAVVDEQAIDLSLHCDELAKFFNLIATSKYFCSTTTGSGEELSWDDVSEWLTIAASVENVNLNTARFDNSIWMCSSAADYHDARSALLRNLVTKISIFNFIWGALETVIKIIDPPKVPKTNSIIDATCGYLKSQFEQTPRLTRYSELVADLRETLNLAMHFGITDQDFKLQSHIGISGIGLHIVRRIRNKFAHGAMRFPEPEEWSGENPKDALVIHLSSKIVLFTMQMLLAAYFPNDSDEIDWEKEIDWDEDDYDDREITISINQLMRVIHTGYQWPSPNQLCLFSD